MRALKKPRSVWNINDLGADPDKCGVKGSPSMNKRVFAPPKRNTETKYFDGNVDAMASAIVDVFEAEGLI